MAPFRAPTSQPQQTQWPEQVNPFAFRQQRQQQQSQPFDEDARWEAPPPPHQYVSEDNEVRYNVRFDERQLGGVPGSRTEGLPIGYTLEYGELRADEGRRNEHFTSAGNSTEYDIHEQGRSSVVMGGRHFDGGDVIGYMPLPRQCDAYSEGEPRQHDARPMPDGPNMSVYVRGIAQQEGLRSEEHAGRRMPHGVPSPPDFFGGEGRLSRHPMNDESVEGEIMREHGMREAFPSSRVVTSPAFSQDLPAHDEAQHGKSLPLEKMAVSFPFPAGYRPSPVTPREGLSPRMFDNRVENDCVQGSGRDESFQANNVSCTGLSPKIRAAIERAKPSEEAVEDTEGIEECNTGADIGHDVERLQGYTGSSRVRPRAEHRQGGNRGEFPHAGNGQFPVLGFEQVPHENFDSFSARTGDVHRFSMRQFEPSTARASSTEEGDRQSAQGVDQKEISHTYDGLFQNGPLLMQRVVGEPRPLLVQETYEEPPESSIEIERPPEPASVKPVKKPSLLELRKKVLMSLMQKKKATGIETEAQMTEDPALVAQSRESAQASFSRSPSRSERVREATRSVNHADMSQQFPALLMPPVWNFNRLIVDVSETESEEESEDDSEDDSPCPHGQSDDYGKTKMRKPPERKRPRHQIIEDMKIRMVQLGKCPSSLHGKQRQSSPSTGPPKENLQTKVLIGNRKEKPVPLVSESQDEIARVKPTDIKAPRQEVEGVKKARVLENPERIPSAADAPFVSKLNGIRREPAGEKQVVKGKDCTEHSSSSISASPAGRDVVAPIRPPEQNPLTSRPARKIPIQSPIAKKTNHGSVEIETLKKRIVMLEQARTIQKRTLTSPNHSNPSNIVSLCLRMAENPNIDSANKESTRTVSGRAVFKRTSPLCVTDPKDGKASLAASKDKRRYYSDEASRKKCEEKLSPLEKKASPSTPDTAKQGAWNHRESKDTAMGAVPDNAEPGLVDDLKSELETSKRQLASVADYSKLFHASDVSLAQAAAKLEFKRNALANLHELLKRAQYEVFDAEQDFDKIASAAKRMRASLGDGPFADMFPMPDIPAAKFNGETSDPAVAAHQASSAVLENEADTQTGLDVGDSMDAELDMSTRSDLVLQQSPYSPSNGDVFSSCLSGIRAYAPVVTSLLLLDDQRIGLVPSSLVAV